MSKTLRAEWKFDTMFAREGCAWAVQVNRADIPSPLYSITVITARGGRYLHRAPGFTTDLCLGLTKLMAEATEYVDEQIKKHVKPLEGAAREAKERRERNAAKSRRHKENKARKAEENRARAAARGGKKK